MDYKPLFALVSIIVIGFVGFKIGQSLWFRIH